MTETATLVRHTAASPCQICGGHAGLPQHRGVRCAGFTLDRVVYCTREEHAGNLPFEISVSPGAFKHRLYGTCGCGIAHGWRAGTSDLPHRAETSPRQTTPIELRHAVYSYALEQLDLRAAALADLRRRGLPDELAGVAGFCSVPETRDERDVLLNAMRHRFTDEELHACPGFFDKNDRLTFWIRRSVQDAYIVPYRDERGRITGIQLKEIGGKYLSPFGANLTSVYHVAGEPREGADLWLTEGGIKSVVARHLGNAVVFAVAGQSLRAEHVDVIERLKPGRVIVALDEESNHNTDLARIRWQKLLWDRGLDVYRATWEGSDVGGPKGIDDLLWAGRLPRLRHVTFTPPEISRRRTPRPVPVAGEVHRGGTLQAARTATQSAIRSFVKQRKSHAGEALLVATPPGVGKTSSAAAAIRETGARARIVVGNNRLAKEMADTHGYSQVRGRNADNCERISIVDALALDGHEVERFACGRLTRPRCPVRGSCAYFQQFDDVGTRVGAAEQFYNARFLRGGDLVIADDADLFRSVFERDLITAETIGTAQRLLLRRRRTALRNILSCCGHAIVEAGLTGKRYTGVEAWDLLARVAAASGDDIADLVGRLPVSGSVPPPDNRIEPLSIEDVRSMVPATVLRLAEALKSELRSFAGGQPFNSGIRIDGQGIEVWRTREPAVDHEEGRSVATMPLLILEATPVPTLVNHLTRAHKRLPDVTAEIELPANVTVAQHASSSNGRSALLDPERRNAVLAEAQQERQSHGGPAPGAEAVICFKKDRDAVIGLGFDEAYVLTFGSVRGSNLLAEVSRLHVVGRPMAPTDELLFMAQVLHHDEEPVSGQLVVEPRRYGGQRYEVDVVDFADARPAALLRATRDDEIVQVIHRARLLTLSAQAEMLGSRREHVRLILHTGHPIDGLRVDELEVTTPRSDLNSERETGAEERIISALQQLQAEGSRVSLNAVARTAHAHKQTVTKVLGKPVHTLIKSLYKGVNHLPEMSSSEQEPVPVPVVEDGFCAGGCGTVIPRGHRKCSPCAAAAVVSWKMNSGQRRAV